MHEGAAGVVGGSGVGWVRRSAVAVPRSLTFTRWVVPAGVSLAAVLPEGVDRCGIYVLEFADGEEYVGQTVSLLSRTASHRRHWPDPIVAIRFVPVGRDDLDTAERAVIARLLDGGVRLRNVDLVTLPRRSEALDLVVDHAVQSEWLSGEVDGVVIGDRGRIAQQRRRTRARYEALTARPDTGRIVDALADYVGACLPWPHATEGRFWTLTSLPSTGSSPTWRRLAAISVNNVETLVLGESRVPGQDWAFDGFVNVAGDTVIGDDLAGYATDSEYRPVGPVKQFWLDRPEGVHEVLSHPELAAGARRLALGLLRKGSGMFGRFHDYNLADDVFARLAGR